MWWSGDNESHLTVHVGGFVDEWDSDKRSDDKLPTIEWNKEKKIKMV